MCFVGVQRWPNQKYQKNNVVLGLFGSATARKQKTYGDLCFVLGLFGLFTLIDEGK